MGLLNLMRIRVIVKDDESWFFEIVCSGVYENGKNKFLMQAGGYDYGSPELDMPISISIIENTHIYLYEKLDSALVFIKWVIETNIAARDSFSRMMD